VKTAKAFAKQILERIGKIIQIDMAYAVKGGSWLIFGNASSSFLLFLLSIAYANFLSKDAFGEFKYIQSIAAILVALTLTGMNTAVTQAVARGFEGTLRKSILVQLKWGIIYTAASLAVGSIYLYQGNLQLGVSLMAISILTPISLSFNTYIAFLNGKKDFKSLSKYNFFSTAFVASCTFLTMLLTHNVVMLIIANAGANALANLAIYFRVLRTHNPNESIDPQAIPYGKHLSLMMMFGTISSQIDSILIFHFLGAAQLAIYTFAVNIPDRLKGFTKILSNLALPKYSQKTPLELRRGIKTKLPFLILLLSVLAIVYMGAAPLFYHTFFPQYQASISLTQIYSISLIASASTITVAALLAERSKRDLYIFTSSASLFQIITSGALIPFFGLSGAVASKLLCLFYNLALSLILLYRPKMQPVEKP